MPRKVVGARNLQIGRFSLQIALGPKNIAGLFKFLTNLDLSAFNVRKPPNTLIGDLISQENANPFEMFIGYYKSHIFKLIHFRHEDSERGFVKCKEGDEGCVPVLSQREMFNLFLKWCINNNLDTKKFNSKKLQTELFRKRNVYKMEYRPNKQNSPLSMWIVKNVEYWKTSHDSGVQSGAVDDSDEDD